MHRPEQAGTACWIFYASPVLMDYLFGLECKISISTWKICKEVVSLPEPFKRNCYLIGGQSFSFFSVFYDFLNHLSLKGSWEIKTTPTYWGGIFHSTLALLKPIESAWSYSRAEHLSCVPYCHLYPLRKKQRKYSMFLLKTFYCPFSFWFNSFMFLL